MLKIILVIRVACLTVSRNNCMSMCMKGTCAGIGVSLGTEGRVLVIQASLLKSK